MKKTKTLLIILFSLMLTLAGTTTITEAHMMKTKELKMERLFKGKKGTMVLKNLKNDHVYVYNPKRSQTRLTPESTFKVPHALIGLETSVLRDEYEVKRWDGVEREFENWNRDHSLASAMRESAIWFYQDMAKDIGPTRMQEKIRLLGYGNRDLSGGIDSFWLDSSLKISALEQVDFMEKLVKETFPFSEEHQKTVKRIMLQVDHDDYTIHGKTGTRLSDNGLGWYVGFIQTKKDTWVFAVNLNGTGTEAKQIAETAFKQMGIIK